MSYHVSVSGHAHNEAAERRLHAELAKLLREDEEYGVSDSSFTGQHVQGTIHLHHAAGTEHVDEHHEEAAGD